MIKPITLVLYTKDKPVLISGKKSRFWDINWT